MMKWCPVRAIGNPGICVDPEEVGKTGQQAEDHLQAVDRHLGCWGKKCAWYGHLCRGDFDTD